MRLTLAALAVGTLATVAGGAETTSARHPRPGIEREQAYWLSLEGPWLFRSDPDGQGLAGSWFALESFEADLYEPIAVPFPWESAVSGIGSNYAGVAWYRKRFDLPASWRGQRVFMVFGAVDRVARVWINGQPAGSSRSPHAPFEVELTGLAAPGESAVVVLRIESGVARPGPRHPFRSSSGILQPVFVEARPPIHLRSLRATPDVMSSRVTFDVEIESDRAADAALLVAVDTVDVPARIHALQLRPGANRASASVALPEARLWSPVDPFLHRATIAIRLRGDEKAPVDRVVTRFGLRRLETSPGPPGHFALNGRPIFIAAARHTGHFLDTGRSWPESEAIDHEIRRALDSGFNAILVSRKVEDPRFYASCDRLGCLVIAGFPAPKASEHAAWADWHAMVEATIDRDFNHPSIVAWALFEDALFPGLATAEPDRVQAAVERVREIDPTRLIIDSISESRSHVATDVNVFSMLMGAVTDLDEPRRRARLESERNRPGAGLNFLDGTRAGPQPLLASLGVRPLARGDQDISFAFHSLLSAARRHERIAGIIWSDLADTEWLHRGIFNFDRSPKQFGFNELAAGARIADFTGAIFVGFDTPSILRLEPGTRRELPVFVNVADVDALRGAKLRFRARLEAFDDRGERVEVELGRQAVTVDRRGVTSLEPVTIDVPSERSIAGAVTATLWSRPRDGSTSDTPTRGTRLAGSFVFLAALAEPPRVAVPRDGELALAFDPVDFADVDTTPAPALRRDLLRVVGAPRIEYRLRIPDMVDPDRVRGVRFEAELASFGGAERLDWPAMRHRSDHPQTDARRAPSRLRLTLNGAPAPPIDLPDAPSDARGFLSLESGYPNGIHGVLCRARWSELPGRSRDLVLRLAVEPGGAGIAIFGASMGRFPLDPAVILELDETPDVTTAAAMTPATVDVLGASGRALLTAPEHATHWRVTRHAPAGDWTEPGFNDSKWSTMLDAAHVGRGDRGLWLRAEFPGVASESTPWIDDGLSTHPDLRGRLYVRVRAPGELTLWLNGVEVYRGPGGLDGSLVLPLADSVRERLVPEANVLAVRARGARVAADVEMGLFLAPR